MESALLRFEFEIPPHAILKRTRALVPAQKGDDVYNLLLQLCVAVSRSEFQCVAVCCSVLQCDEVFCGVL